LIKASTVDNRILVPNLPGGSCSRRPSSCSRVSVRRRMVRFCQFRLMRSGWGSNASGVGRGLAEGKEPGSNLLCAPGGRWMDGCE
jgi:hypothetical protein